MNLIVLPFSEERFFECVQECSTQTEYLFKYLSHIKAGTIILEKQYIDRYYMEEYEHYYSSCFKKMTNYCQRLHFFKEGISDDFFEKYLAGNNSAKKQIMSDYLGYIVLRPLETIRVGRTVLKTYDDDFKRDYITRKYEAHLAGLSLPIKSIAFQQQDRAVGVCATTAIWSSLQKISNDNGFHCPGPYEISQKAIGYTIPLGRTYPQEAGLNSEQMCQAIVRTGFKPLIINCSSQKFNQFKTVLLGYFNSNIPPTMPLCHINFKTGNAITITGHSVKSGDCLFDENLNINVRELEKIYIHDDRIGPYVSTTLEERKFETSELERAQNNGFCSDTAISIKVDSEEWLVSDIIIPLYHKIRLTIPDILKLSYPILCRFQEQDVRSKYVVDVKIVKGGKYLEEIRDNKKLLKKEKIHFLKEVNLSRYVGIAEVTRNGLPYFAILWDTTDIPRNKFKNFEGYAQGILGVVCYDNSARLLFKDFWNRGKGKIVLL